MKQFEPAAIIENMINSQLPKDKAITVQPASQRHAWFCGEIMRDGEMIKEFTIADWYHMPVMHLIKKCSEIAEALE